MKKIVVQDDVVLKNCTSLFAGMKNAVSVSLPDNMRQVTSFSGMFDGCQSIVSVDLSNTDATACESLYVTFRNCLSLEWVYLNGLNTANVTNFAYMFQNCESLKSVDVSDFNTSNATRMSGMFAGCRSLVSLDLRNFSIKEGVMDITNANGHSDPFFFGGCANIQRVALGKNTLRGVNSYGSFAPDIPTTTPYTGKWVCEEDPSIVLTTQQFVENYPNEIAPEGTYVWQTTSAVISFDANGGTTSEPSIVQNGTSTEINLPSGEDTTFRDGYQLVSWNTERDGSGTYYYPGQKITPQQGKNLILYAQWVPLSELSPLKYVIEGYDAPDRNGIYDDPASKNYQGYHRIGSDVVLTSLCPQRAAHVFLGWSTEQTSDIAYLDDDAAAAFLASDKHVTQVTMPADGMIVYAVWQEKYSRKILNGDFEYPSIPFKPGGNGVGHQNGIFNMENGTHSWGNGIEKIPNFEKKRFAWHSTQTIDASPLLIGPGDVEIQQECCTTNRYGEIVGEQENTSIYQDILTTPKVLYKWSLKHCSRSNELATNETGCNDHAMNVLIGTPSGDGEPQSAYRTSTNGSDPIGSVGTIVQTHNRFGHDYSKEWETYEGAYIVPDGQYVTRFSFHSLISGSPTSGNLVDDISFSQAYPLYYDMNDEDSIVKADRNGIYTDDDIALNGYQGYVNEGADNPLTTIVPTRYGYNFLGWSLSPLSPVAKGEEESVSDELVGSVNPTGETRVYAVWQENSAPLTYVIEGYDDLDRNGIYDDPSANDQQGYHEIGSNVTLTNMKPSRAAHEFLGWSSESMDDIAYLDDDAAKAFLGSDKHITEITMPQEGMSVYAVWQEKYSRKILNGDFEHPAVLNKGVYDAVFVSPHQRLYSASSSWPHTHAFGDEHQGKLFAWDSTEDFPGRNWYLPDGATVVPVTSLVEMQHDTAAQNRYAEITAEQHGTAIYQDILTTPSSLYKWTLKHSSARASHIDSMNVIIGTPDNMLPQAATRMTSNGNNSGEAFKVGYTSTDISTDSSTKTEFYLNADQWETYQGYYSVPEGQYVTRFSFNEKEGVPGVTAGNYVDDISFAIAHPLLFDVNGGTNKSIYSDPADDNYAGYHQEGEEVQLPTAPDDLTAPSGCMFLGWSVEKHAWIDENTSEGDKGDVLSSIIADGTYAMPASKTTLYAAYAKLPVVDVEQSDGGTVTENDVTAEGALLPSYEWKVKPDDGFRIAEVVIDGVPQDSFPDSVGQERSLRLSDVSGSHSITIRFEDMRVDMPQVGENGFLVLVLVGGGSLVVVLGTMLVERTLSRKRNGHDGARTR